MIANEWEWRLSQKRLEYNYHRPHSGIDWRTPAAYAAMWKKNESAGVLLAATQAGHTQPYHGWMGFSVGTGPVMLFSIEFEGISEGTTLLTIDPDMITGADFVSWMGESGGDYSEASVGITVPEPASMVLLAVCGLALIRRRWPNPLEE